MAESTFYLSPLLATILFVVAVVAGYQYRRVWKSEGSRRQLWLWGTIAAVCLLAVSILPLQTG